MKKKPSFKHIKSIVTGAKPYAVQLIIASIALALATICLVLAPNYIGELTTYLSSGQPFEMSEITRLGLILSAFYGASFVLNFLSGFLYARVTQLYSRDMRSQIFRKLNDLPLAYFDAHQYGDTLSILTNDVDQIANSLNQGLSMVISASFQIVGVIIAMFITSYQLALTVLAAVPLMLAFLMMVSKLAVPRFQKRQEELGEVNAIVEEQFSGQLVISSFNAQKKKLDAFDKANSSLYKTMFVAQIFGGLMIPISSFISYLTYAAVCIVGGLLMNEGTYGISLGIITEFLVYVQLFQSPLSSVGQAANTLQMASASAARVSSLLEEEETPDDSHLPLMFKVDERNKPLVKGEVEFKNVRFSYDSSRVIIPDFSTHVNPGMKVAIVGPTGAGKTTIVNLLMRFYDIQRGDIYIDNIDYRLMSRKELRSAFAMVLQDSFIFEGTLKENITYGDPSICDEKVSKVLEEANLSHFVSSLPDGINSYIGGESSLSSGQKQMISIARAMALDAPMLILDEATSNVDTRTEEEIQEAMDRLTKNKTSFVIAHRLSTIKNANLILVLKDGDIIEQGDHETLMKKGGFYCSLYNSQFALN